MENLALLACRKGYAIVRDYKNVMGGWIISFEALKPDGNTHNFICNEKPNCLRPDYALCRAECEAQARAWLNSL